MPKKIKKKESKVPKPGKVPKPKSKPSKASPGSSGLPEKISTAQIRATMKKSMKTMRGCVQQQVERDPTVKGTMAISFVISGDGKVSSVRILSGEHKGTYVAGCITFIIKNMTFPKFSGEPITIPRVPLKLGN